MSLITHRCVDCGHPDYWRLCYRDGTRCPAEGCACRCTPGAPEVIPTFDSAGQKVDKVIKPGKPLAAAIPTHDCDACRALYAELTGAAA